jgi:hypothetical protein
MVQQPRAISFQAGPRKSKQEALTNTHPDAISNPLETSPGKRTTPQAFKYEFPSQASLGIQDSVSTDDDEAHLTSDPPVHKRGAVSPCGEERRSNESLATYIGFRVVNLASAGIDHRHIGGLRGQRTALDYSRSHAPAECVSASGHHPQQPYALDHV